MIVIYHNNRCSKSRLCLELIKKSNTDYKVIEYLKENLGVNNIKEIAKIQLQNLENRLNKKNLKFKITNEAINQLVQNSFDIAYGARPLKRIIQKQIETKISNNILNNHYLYKDDINIYLVNREIIVD